MISYPMFPIQAFANFGHFWNPSVMTEKWNRDRSAKKWRSQPLTTSWLPPTNFASSTQNFWQRDMQILAKLVLLLIVLQTQGKKRKNNKGDRKRKFMNHKLYDNYFYLWLRWFWKLAILTASCHLARVFLRIIIVW